MTAPGPWSEYSAHNRLLTRSLNTCGCGRQADEQNISQIIHVVAGCIVYAVWLQSAVPAK